MGTRVGMYGCSSVGIEKHPIPSLENSMGLKKDSILVLSVLHMG